MFCKPRVNPECGHRIYLPSRVVSAQAHILETIPYSHEQLLDAQQLDVKDERRVAGNARKRLVSIGHLGGNSDATLSTSGHAGETEIPALDDLTSAELEAERAALLVGC